MKLQKDISRISFYATIKPLLMLSNLLKKIMGKGEVCIFSGTPCILINT